MRKISKTYKIDRKRTIYIPSEEDKIIHAGINKELRKKYNIYIKDRDAIIESLISILTQGDYNRIKIPPINYTIVRTDIKNFFPSINKHKLYQKISNSNVLSKETLDLLKPMFFHKSVKGVPIGFSFSNSLAELYLENFDDDIITSFTPTFYFRYVDDIILILSKKVQNEREFKEKCEVGLDEIFKRYHLKRNEEKTDLSFWRNRNGKFNYLGYSFEKSNDRLIVDISKEKYNRLIKQIKGYFYDYNTSIQNKTDFWILYYRLKNRLYAVTSDTEKNLKFGLGFSYKYINSEHNLNNVIKLITYNIRKLSLTSKQRNTLFSLIRYNESSIEIIRRHFNYNKLTHRQLDKMCNKLNIPLFEHSTKTNKVKMVFNILKTRESIGRRQLDQESYQLPDIVEV